MIAYKWIPSSLFGGNDNVNVCPNIFNGIVISSSDDVDDGDGDDDDNDNDNSDSSTTITTTPTIIIIKYPCHL